MLPDTSCSPRPKIMGRVAGATPYAVDMCPIGSVGGASDIGFVDVFSGCGGLAWGFRAAGFDPVGAVEANSDAVETYRANIDDRVLLEYIEDVNSDRRWPKASILIGGPPCQGFSQLGSRDPADPRNKLWREFLTALDISGAEFLVMENVPRMFASRQYGMFRREVERRGFSLAEGILNAAAYGVPQIRRRAIVFGWKRGTPILPRPTHGAGLLPHATVRGALAGLTRVPDGSNWHRPRPQVRDISLTRYRAVPPDGGNRFQMQHALEVTGRADLVPDCWKRKTSGTTDVFGRLWWDRPSVTIRTEFYKPEKGRYLHPEEDRAITVREAARLQSFPDEFRFPENQSMVSVARQIGNAVPPGLAFAIAGAVAAHLTSDSKSILPEHELALA
jgi:DNA (cytosine-5)-methyltransferase 1